MEAHDGETFIAGLFRGEPAAGFTGLREQATGTRFGSFVRPLAWSDELRTQAVELGGEFKEVDGALVSLAFTHEWLWVVRSAPEPPEQPPTPRREAKRRFLALLTCLLVLGLAATLGALSRSPGLGVLEAALALGFGLVVFGQHLWRVASGLSLAFAVVLVHFVAAAHRDLAELEVQDPLPVSNVSALQRGRARLVKVHLRPVVEPWTTRAETFDGRRKTVEITEHAITMALDERSIPQAVLVCATTATAGCSRHLQHFDGWVSVPDAATSAHWRTRIATHAPDLGDEASLLPVLELSEAPTREAERLNGLALGSALFATVIVGFSGWPRRVGVA